MDASDASDVIFTGLSRYRIHILVFLTVLFIGLTFAHPELLLTDEWITANQLHQLHDGHQVLMNEGKYGLYENGTPNAYFAARGNRLAYSLFLPLISLPSLWIVDLFGDHFAFFVLYLWTFILLFIILSLHFLFREYSYIGKWRWTPAAIGAVFLLFFINLFYYTGFSVSDPRSFPEITAIVFTNIILLAFAGVLIYEINRTLFEEPDFALFGTIACIFSSSYVFWATGCKDHILTMLLFVSVLLCMVKFRKTEDPWNLPLAFLLTGLLAWAPPELALWVFLFSCLIWGYSIFCQMQKKQGTALLLSSPFFTLLGALPFFLNNYLVTKNPLLPPNTLYLSGESASSALRTTSQLQQAGDLPGASLIQIISLKSSLPSSDIPGDILGILFHPLNGSMGLLPLTPLFLVMAILAIVLVLLHKQQFSRDEIQSMAIIAVLAMPVFLAYVNNLHQLNTSMGITPDMRYLSPLYVPLTLLGLIIMRRTQVTCDRPVSILIKMLVISALGIPVSVYLTARAYADPNVAAELAAPLSMAFTLCILILAALTLVFLVRAFFSKRGDAMSDLLIASLCALPFIWQINISVIYWLFSATRQGYDAWIPITNILYHLFSSPLLVH